MLAASSQVPHKPELTRLNRPELFNTVRDKNKFEVRTR